MDARVLKDIPQEMADRYVLVSSAGHLFFFFFFFLDGSCKSSFVWSAAGRSLLSCRLLLQKRGKQGGEAIRGGIWEWEMRMDYMGMSGKCGDGTEGRARCLCARVLHYDWDAVGGLQRSSHRNTLTLKGLNTHSSSLKPSNVFIWWFLRCCFSASFHCARLFSIPWSAARSMFRTHPASAMTGRL